MASKVLTGVVRVSFPHLFTPRSIVEGQSPKYSCTLLIPKDDKATVEAINAALSTELKAMCPDGKKPAGLKLPVKNGDGMLDKNDVQRPECVGMYAINATSARKPGIVDSTCQKIVNPDEIYGGCFCRVQIAFSPYNLPASKGIGCYLNNVQKIKDGTPFAGWERAEDVFTPVPGGVTTTSADPSSVNVDLDAVLRNI